MDAEGAGGLVEKIRPMRRPWPRKGMLNCTSRALYKNVKYRSKNEYPLMLLGEFERTFVVPDEVSVAKDIHVY